MQSWGYRYPGIHFVDVKMGIAGYTRFGRSSAAGRVHRINGGNNHWI